MARALASCCALFVFFIAASSGAVEKFPGFIQANLELEATPDCTLCHKNDDGGKGTVIRPFGISMQRLGLNKNSKRGDMDSFLARMDSEATDSDGDGTADLDELRSGENPNLNPDGSAPSFGNYPLPETGCSVGSRAHSKNGRDVFASVVFAFAVALFCRRNRSR